MPYSGLVQLVSKVNWTLMTKDRLVAVRTSTSHFRLRERGRRGRLWSRS